MIVVGFWRQACEFSQKAESFSEARREPGIVKISVVYFAGFCYNLYEICNHKHMITI